MEPGHVIGPFVTTHRLGRGAMGEVWQARFGDDHVAIKLLRPGSFLREVAAVARLSHPHIVGVYEYDTLPDGTPWMAMELCSGGTLGQHPPRDWPTLRDLMVALLDALGHAHARGLVHRDVKPGNVLLGGPGDLRPGWKLADFGIAWTGTSDDGAPGTPRYMAPEQFAGDPAAFGPWTDLYGLGCVAFELTQGEPPFRGHPRALALALAHTTARPPRLVPQLPVPEGFEGWLATLLSKAPHDRFRCAADARHALLQLGDVSGSATATAPTIAPTLTAALSDGVPGDVPLVGTPSEVPRAVPHPAPLPRSVPAPIPSRPAPRRLGRRLHALRTVPLVGRRAELEELWDYLIRSVADEQPRTVLLHGPVQSGKTRLAEELWFAAREAGCGGLRADPQTGWVLPAQPDDPVRAWAMVRAWAADRPLVLLLDDVGEDPDLLGLALAATGHAALILLTVRDDTLATNPALAARLHDVPRIRVGPLPERDRPALGEAALGLSRALSDELAVRAQGLPGPALDMVADWIARDQLVDHPGGLELAPGVRVAVPADATDAWRARVDAAAPAEPLELAAALGEHVDRATWQALTGGANDDREADLVRRVLAYPTSRGFRFAHPAIMQLLRERAGDRWPALHARCAAVTQGEARARHLVAAGQGRQAIDGLLEAAHQRHLRGQFHRARALYAQRTHVMHDVSVPVDDRRWAAGWTFEAVTWRMLGDFARCEALGEQVAALGRALGDPDVEAEGLVTQGLAAIVSDRQQEGLEQFDRALALTSSRAVEARAAMARAAVLLELGRPDAAEADLQRAMACDDRPYHLAEGHRLLGHVAYRRGDLDGFARETRHAMAQYEALDDRWGVTTTLGDLGVVAHVRGELEQAAEHYEACMAGWRALGTDEWLVPMSNLTLVHVLRGALPRALREASHVEAQAGRRGRAGLVSIALSVQMAAAAELGDASAFDGAVARSHDVPHPVLESDLREMAWRAQKAWTDRGDPVRAAHAEAWRERWTPP